MTTSGDDKGKTDSLTGRRDSYNRLMHELRAERMAGKQNLSEGSTNLPTGDLPLIELDGG